MIKSVGIVSRDRVELALGQHLFEVISNKFNLTLMPLKLESAIASSLAFGLLKSENRVVQQLAESVVEEFADWHLSVLVGVFEIFEHFGVHVLSVARFCPFNHLLSLLLHSFLLVSVEFDFRVEFSSHFQFLIAFLKLSFHLLKLSARFKEIGEGLHGLSSPVLLMVVSFVEAELFQRGVFLELISHQLESFISNNSNVQLFNGLAVVSSFNHALQAGYTQVNAFKLQFSQSAFRVHKDALADILASFVSEFAILGLLADVKFSQVATAAQNASNVHGSNIS